MRLLGFLALLVVLASPAHAQWRKSETKHFTIYTTGNAESLRNFAIKVERFDSVLRRRYSVRDEETPQKLTIFMLTNQGAVSDIHGSGDRGVAGFYVPNGEGSMAVVPRASGNSKYDLDADAVLFHEYTHHFMIRNFPVAYPAWFVEGFAEFLATVDFTKEGNAKVGTPPYYRGYSLAMELPIPATRLLTADVEEIAFDQRDAFYGRAWLLTHYLNFNKARAGQLGKYLNAINAGSTNIDAAKESFGDLAVLDKELKSYLSQRKISYVQELRPTPAPDRIDISEVSAGGGATMLQRLRLMRGVGDDERATIIEALRSAAAKFPKAHEPQVLLAQAYFDAGEDAKAIAAADAALALSPAESRAMLYRGEAMLRQNVKDGTSDAKLWKEARNWVVKANRANVNDPMPLFAYYRSFGQQGVAPPALSLDGLRRAYQMAPEDRTIRMTYASALADQKKYAPAIRLVETVAFDPHSGPGSEEARRILKRLKAAQEGKPQGEEDLFGEAIENKPGK